MDVVLVHVGRAADATQLFYALRDKILVVKDYTADVKIKIDVNYMRIPLVRGKLYFKAPDKMRLERNGGLSILPKKNINLTLNNLMPTGNVTVIDMGMGTVARKKVHIIKVVPDDDKNNIILTKIWIDESNLLALRTETTTRDEGTVIMNLEFGRYISYGLPDKVTILMDVKDYKLPSGVTMDYNDPTEIKKIDDGKPKKGTVQIEYLKYDINKGLSDEVFKDKSK